MIDKPELSIAALGGTFDHFHVGHENFLRFASQFADKVLVGITKQSLVIEKDLSQLVEPLEIRKQAVQRFCESETINFEIVELSDAFGPTLGERELECVVVTELTKSGGAAINEKRRTLGLSELPIQVCSMVRDSSGEVVTSTRIRRGEINRQGEIYSDIFKQDVVLSDDQKNGLKDPLGPLTSKPAHLLPEGGQAENSGFIAVVGDTCLENFIQNGWSYSLGVYDLRKQRQAFEPNLLHELKPNFQANNPPGQITQELVHALEKIITSGSYDARSHPSNLFGLSARKVSRVNLLINGEEDLATAALILLLPLESRIYYGQPAPGGLAGQTGEGMVEVVVSEEIKENMYCILR